MAKYAIKDGKLVRSNLFCPRCGRGVFLADRGDWWSCGKCGDRYHKRSSDECSDGQKMKFVRHWGDDNGRSR
jgi:small subunit ribosomal protein S27Ae